MLNCERCVLVLWKSGDFMLFNVKDIVGIQLVENFGPLNFKSLKSLVHKPMYYRKL